jgi:leucyl aminopeptidase
MSNSFIKPADITPDHDVIPIYICRPDAVEACVMAFTPAQQEYAQAHGFNGGVGQAVLLPKEDGRIAAVLFGAGSHNDYSHGPVQTGALAEKLANGIYRIADKPADWNAPLTAVMWGMGAYKFSRYLKKNHIPAQLVLDEDMNPDETIALVGAMHNGRDYINTPTNDMGPIVLQDAAQKLCDRFGASLSAVIGDDLLAEDYPMIHAVGRAAEEPPRLIEINWGNDANPSLTLVGKGITFDTGGLNIKSAGGMRIMKKDMGGSAHALALAEMIMATGLPIRLRVFLAVAENAISANAFRPGDILSSRKGLSVEIDNTDAEGRLVLGDALTRASEDKPDLIIDFATLTGAARVALGPTLAPFFSNRDAPVKELLQTGHDQADPFWHMPLWGPYLGLLSSPIADLKNAGSSFGGSITAALFLQKFVSNDDETGPWMHFDVYGWNPTAAPSRPKGGEVMTIRAVYHWLKNGGLKKL